MVILKPYWDTKCHYYILPWAKDCYEFLFGTGQNVATAFCNDQKNVTPFCLAQYVVVTCCSCQNITMTFFTAITTFCPGQNIEATFCPILVLQQPQSPPSTIPDFVVL